MYGSLLFRLRKLQLIVGVLTDAMHKIADHRRGEIHNQQHHGEQLQPVLCISPRR